MGMTATRKSILVVETALSCTEPSSFALIFDICT